MRALVLLVAVALLVAPRPSVAAEGVGLTDLPPAELEMGVQVEGSSTVRIPVRGAFELVGVVNNVRGYEIALPVRPRVMFLSTVPPGMEVRRGEKKLTFSQDEGKASTWAYSAHGLTVRVAGDAARPSPDEYTVRWPDAEERQEALDAPATVDATSARRVLQVGGTTRTGLLLPAPAHVAWQVDVPAGGVLRFTAGVVPPEVARDAPSDGTTLVVRVGDAERARVRLAVGRFDPVEVDLSHESNTTARIELRVEDADPIADFAFVAEPRVLVPSAHPRRVVFAFIDTLRRDHLGTYGYARAPAPNIDALGAQGIVFEDARSVAPWTLPSTRSVLSGNQPERWSASTPLPEMLASRGWATGAFVGNIYLTGNFDMASGWGEHGSVNLPYADYEVARGIDFLDRHADEDAMVMVHFMDLHLPYKELWPYRHKYSSQDLPGLGDVFARATLLSYAKGKGKKQQVRGYLQDRYDQNLASVDDALGRLFAAAGPDALVVVFADHGEEFFDHGDLEHGHSLYDELLRVPLLIRAPGLAPRRVDSPASLLDVTPTVLDLLGLGGGTWDGMSLLALAKGEVDKAFKDRPRAFGRLLYGPNAWGSLVGSEKWISRGGKEEVFDLAHDPGEEHALAGADVRNGRRGLADALHEPVRAVLRVTPTSSRGSGKATITVPGGVTSTWLGDEPTRHANATFETRTDDDPRVDTVTMSFSSSGTAQREVYLLPELEPAEAVQGAVLGIPSGPSETLVARTPATQLVGPLAKVTKGNRTYQATWAVVPLPFGDELDGFDAESAAALQALGYLDADHGTGDAPSTDDRGDPADRAAP